MRKEVRAHTEHRACDVCGRSILKGEHTEPYLAPGGERKVVCELCTAHASRMDWILESAHGELPFTGRRAEPRRSIWARLTGRPDGGGAATSAEAAGPPGDGPVPERGPSGDERPASDGGQPAAPPDAEGGADPSASQAPATDGPEAARRRPRAGGPPGAGSPPPGGAPRGPGRGRRDEARHVRAVPTNAQVKVERAFQLFNASEHPRAIAGIARSLGEPWVSAAPLESAPSEVVILIAWELSWYRYRVDLGDAGQPVLLLEKGEELDQLGDRPREWNGAAAADGRLVTAASTSARA